MAAEPSPKRGKSIAPPHSSRQQPGKSNGQSSTSKREAVAGVGAQLRERRLAAGLSLRQFAKVLDVSPSFISQLENGKSQPSVATLYQICSALDVTVDELFTQVDQREPGRLGHDSGVNPRASTSQRPPRHSGSAPSAPVDRGPRAGSPVVSEQDRPRLILDTGVAWERLAMVPGSGVDFMFVRYDVGGSSTVDERLTRHSGIEYGYVLVGELEITLGFETYRVRAGDAISFDSSVPHRLRNVSDVPVEAIWFVHGRDSGHAQLGSSGTGR